jgi:hypothetical protein
MMILYEMQKSVNCRFTGIAPVPRAGGPVAAAAAAVTVTVAAVHGGSLSQDSDGLGASAR